MLSHFRNRYFLLIDLILLSVTPTIALSLRLQIPWDAKFTEPLIFYTIVALLIKVLTFYFVGIYRQFWRYASIDSLLTIVWGVGASSVLITGIVFSLYGTGSLGNQSLPRSIPLIDSMLTLIVVAGTRMSLRVLEYQRGGGHTNPEGKRVLIAGAGDAGQMVAREIHGSKYVDYNLVGFVDDDPTKIGMVIHNVPVLGPLDDLPDLINKRQIDQVIIAMPTADGSVIRKVVEYCENSGVTAKTLPGIFELLSGKVSVSHLREVEIGDLLRREAVSVNTEPVRDLLKGKRVLVTGAGGSIGSELCSQISQFRPGKLLALGHGENSLFQLPKKIDAWNETEKEECLKLIVADIRDESRIDVVFSRYQPEIIFHAAAHKHVPLMEENLEDAVTNNVLGTRNLVDRAVDHDVERFVLISTDKAVEPVNVMGMTKRVAELIVKDAAVQTRKPFVSVRFGNVLGSRGSVVPLFQRQIAAGGAVTVTHPEVERYFMTISEAVQLVLQASALGENGETFVLDMGEQISITALAEQIIELSGLKVGDDIKIVYTGLRPGEKISEKLYSDQETLYGTRHHKVNRIISEEEINREFFSEQVGLLIKLAENGKRLEARRILEELTQL
jgi:FlaA1/EpsC-like NDP-sugar epimerase